MFCVVFMATGSGVDGESEDFKKTCVSPKTSTKFQQILHFKFHYKKEILQNHLKLLE